MAVRRRTAVGAATALTAALGASWAWVHRRDLARLDQDPDRDILTAVPPGRPTSITVADGTLLHVRVTTPSRPRATIVFAHGWSMGLRFWVHQLRALGADHLVVAYDQRGHEGSSKVGAAGFDIDALGGDLAAVIDAFAPPDLPVVVVGHSLGGMSILAAARRDDVRERVAGAVLVDTGAAELTAGMFRPLGLLEPIATTLGGRVIRARLPVPNRTTPVSSRIVRAVALNPSASPSAVALTEQLFLDCPVEARAGIGLMLADLDLTDAIERWKVPTTVVVGSRDRMTPPHQARRLVRDLPEATLVVLGGAGHQSPLERPHEVSRVIRDRVAAALADR